MTEPLPYHLPVYETIGKAWKKVYGAKGSLWAALLINILISFCFGFISGLLQDSASFISNIINFVGQVISFLLQLGILYIGIRRAFDLPISYKMMFQACHLDIAWRVICVYLLQLVILIIPIIIMIVSGIMYMQASGVAMFGIIGVLIGVIVFIFLAMRMSMSMAFVLDKETNPWPAIQQSFKVTRSNVWRLIGISILQMCILIVSVIPLGIGLIWTLPFVFILYGMIYKNLSLNVSH